MLLVVLLATIAPFCHVHGAVVALALVPAVAGGARRCGKRGVAWIVALLVLGASATVVSLFHATRIGAENADFLGTLTAAPADTALALLRAIGGLWFDLVPGFDVDELALGVASLALPIALLWLGDRSDEARVAAAPWWSCICFSLLLFALDTARYGFEPPVGTMREAMFGAFLLPVGAFGLLAARFGAGWLAFGAGWLVVLSVQDWSLGIERLRLAHMRAEQVEASLARTDWNDGERPLPVRTPEEQKLLRDRGWVPGPPPPRTGAIAVFAASAAEIGGTCTGGSPTRVDGELRSSLGKPTFQLLLLLAQTPSGEPKAVAVLHPEFAGNGRSVPWQIPVAEPLAPGTRVRVVGYLVRTAEFVPLGPMFTVDGDALTAAAGP
jgi:hypothetical protein